MSNTRGDSTNSVNSLRSFAQRNQVDKGIYSGILAVSCVLGALALSRTWMMIPLAFDLGWMVSGLGAIAREGLLAPISWSGIALLEDHFSPLLVPLAPLGNWMYGGLALTAIQAAAIGVALLLLWQLLKESRLPVTTAVLLLAAAALHPALLYAGLFDVHANVLALPFLVVLLKGIIRERSSWTVVGGVGASLLREDVALFVLLLVLINHRRIQRRVLFSLAGFSVALIAVWMYLAGGASTGAASMFGYVDLQEPVDSVVKAWGYFSEGGIVLSVLLVLVTPWIFFGKPSWRVLLPGIAVSLPLLFAATPVTRVLAFHYYAAIPIIAAASFADVAKEIRLSGSRRFIISGLVIAWTALGPLGASSLTSEYTGNSLQQVLDAAGRPSFDPDLLRAAVHCTNGADDIAVESRVTPWVGQRARVYLLPHPFEDLFFRSGLGLVPMRSADPTARPQAVITSDPLPVPSEYVQDETNRYVWWRPPAESCSTN